MFRNDRKNLIYFIVFTVVMFVISELVIGFVVGYFESENETELYRKGYAVENKVENIMLNVNTMNDAYASFMEENLDATEEESAEFLTHLFTHEINYINNIAYIEGTTIKYNYPKEGNESTVGADLSTVPDQSNYFLEARKSKEEVFFGPVELIQGGQAFILVTPIYENGIYRSSVATVIKESALTDLLNEQAELFDISISLATGEGENPFINSGYVFSNDPVKIVMDTPDISWYLTVYPNSITHYRLYTELTVRLITILIIVFVVYFLRKRNNHFEEIKFKASHDFLTSNYNRAKFIEDFVNDEFSDSLIAYMDVNKFKVLNDTLGHQFGDWALIKLSKELQSTNLFNVYRNSGDEFFLISKEPMSQERFLDVTKGFKYSFFNEVLKQNIHVSLAVGFIPQIPKKLELETMLMYLDYAMYDSKKFNRTYTMIDKELMMIYDKQKNMESMLIEDIKRNNFINYYQPIIDVETGSIYSVEVLSRWQYKNEILPAGKFIDIVKKIRYIEKVDQNLFDNLQREYTQFRDKVENIDSLKFSINLSAELLKSFEADYTRFDKYVKKMVIPKDNIIFEISEDINLGIISDNIIDYIKDKGFQLVIDDFGSGVSKLSDVLSGNLLAIKTDKSMIPLSKKDNKRLKGFTTIVKAVKSTGSMVCVEGVESKEQLQLVQETGCKIVQGYYFGFPLNSDDIVSYINEFDISKF